MLTIYQNGTILTMAKAKEEEETAEAVLVKDGYIQKVGSLQEVEKVELKHVDSFTLQDIFECGQCFRWNKQEDGSYIGVVKNNVIQVEQTGDTILVKGIGEDSLEELCLSYFDMQTDYGSIKQKLSRNRFLFKNLYFLWTRNSYFASRFVGSNYFLYYLGQ